MLIDNNTVSAQNQMHDSSVVSFLGNPDAKRRILIVGNSITRHAAEPEIGWLGDWGMAASALEKDYVHRLFAKLVEDGQDVFLRIRQGAEWEVHFEEGGVLKRFEADRDFHADVVVFRLGENVTGERKRYFRDPLREFADYICPNGKILFTTCFWAHPGVDDVIAEIANERGEDCIDCGFSRDEKNMALGQFAHSGVAHHPSDAGMEKIAEAIFEGLKKTFDSSRT